MYEGLGRGAGGGAASRARPRRGRHEEDVRRHRRRRGRSRRALADAEQRVRKGRHRQAAPVRRRRGDGARGQHAEQMQARLRSPGEHAVGAAAAQPRRSELARDRVGRERRERRRDVGRRARQQLDDGPDGAPALVLVISADGRHELHEQLAVPRAQPPHVASVRRHVKGGVPIDDPILFLGAAVEIEELGIVHVTVGDSEAARLAPRGAWVLGVDHRGHWAAPRRRRAWLERPQVLEDLGAGASVQCSQWRGPLLQVGQVRRQDDEAGQEAAGQ